jgi:beta-glucanase (GH16 family)
MRFLFGNLALVLLFAGGVNTACGQLIWSDEFENGTALDSNTWSYDLGDEGWGNQELQNYTSDPDNVRLEGGNLVINIRSTGEGANRQFTSARVRTQDKLTFKYGRIEARIKMPDLANGLWPAFWTLGNNFSDVGWPFCGELDIVEMGSGASISNGLVNQRVGSTAHWDNSGNYANYGRVFDTNVDLNDDYHIFSMNWTPERVTTYIDGQQIWTMLIQQDQCASCSEFHEPHFVILNVAVGGTYTGLLSPGEITAQTPAMMLVDYVHIYDNGYTQLGGSSIPEQQVPGMEYMGSWFSPDQSGHGFSISFGQFEDGSPIAAVYWYTYDDQGNPIFLLGTGTLSGSTLEVQLESPTDMRYGEFETTSPTPNVGGMAVFNFNDPQNATFSYSPSEFSENNWGHTTAIENLPIERLFTVPVTASSVTTQ